MKKARYHYSFTNQFEYTGLKDRIRMMNQGRSDAGWWRYALLWILTVLLVMACQNWKKEESQAIRRPSFPLTNPTRILVDQIESNATWGRFLTYYQKQSRGKAASVLTFGEPVILNLKEGTLSLAEPYRAQTILYLNGKEASPDLLANLKIEYIDELFILQQFEGMDNEDPNPYRVLIQLSDQPIEPSPGQQNLASLLEAAALSAHPLGTSRSYTMNKLLEATFFGYRDVFVKRTKNQHLKIQDEFAEDIDVLINGIVVDPKEVETVHVREVDRLYTHERPYTKWMRKTHRQRRYVLFIQTSPKRAVRDSSYYVFSPFYSGDF